MFDLEKHSHNPKINQSFMDLALRQKKLFDKIYPPGTRFKCMKCGECCKYNFFQVNIREDILKKVRRIGRRHPHGYWILIGGKVNHYLPDHARAEATSVDVMHFSGRLPPKWMEWLGITGHKHGYWVLNNDEKIVIYIVEPCIHLKDDNTCGIHDTRPRICRAYFCRRYPVFVGRRI